MIIDRNVQYFAIYLDSFQILDRRGPVRHKERGLNNRHFRRPIDTALVLTLAHDIFADTMLKSVRFFIDITGSKSKKVMDDTNPIAMYVLKLPKFKLYTGVSLVAIPSPVYAFAPYFSVFPIGST